MSIVSSGGVVTITNETDVTLDTLASSVASVTKSGNGSYYITEQIKCVNSSLLWDNSIFEFNFHLAAFNDKAVECDVNSHWKMEKSAFLWNVTVGGVSDTLSELLGDGNDSGRITWEKCYFMCANDIRIFVRAYNSASASKTNTITDCVFTQSADGGWIGRIGGTNSIFKDNIFHDQGPFTQFEAISDYSNNKITNADNLYAWNSSNSNSNILDSPIGIDLITATVQFQTSNVNDGRRLTIIDENSNLGRAYDNGSTQLYRTYGDWVYRYTPTVLNGVTAVENSRLYIENSSGTQLINKLSDASGEYTENQIIHSTVTVDLSSDSVATFMPGIFKYRKYGEVFIENIFAGDSKQSPSIASDTNTVVVLSEAAAAALTGIAYVGDTSIALTTNKTISEIYDNSQAWSAESGNIQYDMPLISLGGTNFTLNGYDLTITATTLSGAGKNIVAGTNTVSLLTSSDCTATITGGTVAIDTAGAYPNLSLDGNTMDFQTAGTYDLRDATIEGTLDLTNSSGGNVTVQLALGVSATNTGPNITVDQDVPAIKNENILDGSSVRIYNDTTASELDLIHGLATGTGYELPITIGVEANLGDTITIQGMKSDGLVHYQYYTEQGIVTASGVEFIGSQVLWTEANNLGIDGSIQTEFSLDAGNIQFDIDSPDGEFQMGAAVSWAIWATQSDDGMRFFFGAMGSLSDTLWQIDVTISDVYFDNLSVTHSISQIDGIIVTRSDGVYPEKAPSTGGFGIGMAIDFSATTEFTVKNAMTDQGYTPTRAENLDNALTTNKFIALK